MVENSQIESSFAEIRKRNGDTTKFDQDKITNAIYKALLATSEGDRDLAQNLTDGVLNKLSSQGLDLNYVELDKLTSKSEIISDCNKISKILDGGLLVKLPFDGKAKDVDIKKAIEKACSLISSFKPIKHTN